MNDHTQSLIRQYLDARQYERAVEGCLSVLASNPFDGWGLLMLSYAYLSMERYDECAGAALEASYHLESNPDRALAFLYLGEATHLLEDYEKADEYYKKAMELQPGNAVHLARYAKNLAFLGQLDEADKLLKRAEGMEPYDLSVLWAKIMVQHTFYIDRDLEEESLWRYLSLSTNMLEPYCRFVDFHLKYGEFAEAYEYAAKAFLLDPESQPVKEYLRRLEQHGYGNPKVKKKEQEKQEESEHNAQKPYQRLTDEADKAPMMEDIDRITRYESRKSLYIVVVRALFGVLFLAMLIGGIIRLDSVRFAFCFLAILIAATLKGLVSTIRLLFPGAKKSVRMFCDGTPDPAATFKQLEKTWKEGEIVDAPHLRMDKDYVIVLTGKMGSGTEVKIIPLKHAVWICPNKKKTGYIDASNAPRFFVRSDYSNYEQLDVYYDVSLTDSSGYKHEKYKIISSRDVDLLATIVNGIQTLCPDIAVGSEDELKELWRKKDISGLRSYARKRADRPIYLNDGTWEKMTRGGRSYYTKVNGSRIINGKSWGNDKSMDDFFTEAMDEFFASEQFPHQFPHRKDHGKANSPKKDD